MAANQPSKHKGTPKDSDRATSEVSGGEKRSEAVVAIKLNLDSERKTDKSLEEGALRNAREVVRDWRQLYKGHLPHERILHRRDKVAGSRRSEGSTRDTWISTSPDAGRNIYMRATSPRGAGWHNLTSLPWRTWCRRANKPNLSQSS